MLRWRFKNYIGENGKNRVRKWVDDLSVKERAKLDRLLMALERTQQWREPHYKSLGSIKKGLGEIRWKGQGKQLRLLGCQGPAYGRYTLLLGCSHKGDRYTPTNALVTAALIMAELEKGIGETCDHEIETD